MTKTRGVNTPVVAQVVGSSLTILLLLANSSRATANLFTFIILLSTAAILVLYFASSLAAWKLTTTLGQRAIITIAVAFIAFATYGVGLEASLWCLVLLAGGLAIRTVMRRMNSRAAMAPA
jgi:APA family basic amino acid/polyamine antiporter